MSWSETHTFLDGEWFEGNKPIVGVRTHAFWLASSVFDGARAFDGRTPDLNKHCARVNRSAEVMGLKALMSVEAMLVQRLSSYRSTGATAHGAQAAFIIRAIGARLDMARLAPLATREGVVAYYNAVRTLALGTPTTALDEQTFRDLYWAMKTPRVTAAEAVSRVSAARVRAETPAPPALTEPSTVRNPPSP